MTTPTHYNNPRSDMGTSHNWSSYHRRQRAKGSGYVRRTPELRANPPKAEVVEAYRYSLSQAVSRGDTAYVEHLTAKLHALTC